MRESKIEKYLVAQVEGIGGECVKFPPLFYRGFVDRLLYMPGGVHVMVETKAPGETPRLLQRKVHARFRALGFRVEVLDTIEAINDFINPFLL